VTARVDYSRSYDATINDAAQTDYLRERARKFAGAENVVELSRPRMGSEDFAYMLRARPGSYFFLGTATGRNDKPLHHPGYDFNDDIIPVAAAFWTDLVEDFLRP
jgi:hippurate hydrolase